MEDYKKHLHVCTFKPKPTPKYFKLDVNQNSLHCAKTVDIKTMERSDFLPLYDRLNAIFKNIGSMDFGKMILNHPALEERMQQIFQDGKNSKKKSTLLGKHARQQSSLLANMDRINLIDPNVISIEWGAGSAEFSQYYYRAVTPYHHILIDRKPVKLKLTHDFKQISWERVIIDIKDLDLDLLIENSDKPLVSFSKHLCGSATDLTLRCLFNFKSKRGTACLKGLVIALCCHVLCRYNQYINIPFLEKHGIDANLFSLLCQFSTWACCGLPKDGPAE
jgi:tRNA:m4X modification enzyme